MANMTRVVGSIVTDVIPNGFDGIWNNPPRLLTNGKMSNRTFKILGVKATPEQLRELDESFREYFGYRYTQIRNMTAKTGAGSGFRRTGIIDQPKLVVTFKF